MCDCVTNDFFYVSFSFIKAGHFTVVNAICEGYSPPMTDIDPRCQVCVLVRWLHPHLRFVIVSPVRSQPKQLLQLLQALIAECLEVKPDRRPLFKEIVERIARRLIAEVEANRTGFGFSPSEHTPLMGDSCRRTMEEEGALIRSRVAMMLSTHSPDCSWRELLTRP